MATDNKHRINTTLPAYHLKWLRVLAWLKGVPPTTLASNTLQARIEANIDLTKEMILERSQDLGISPEDLIDKIINNSDDND